MTVDLWSAYREGSIGKSKRPFVSYLILFEEVPVSRTPVKDVSPNFSLFSEFRDASYAERYNILCKKLNGGESVCSRYPLATFRIHNRRVFTDERCDRA